MENVVNSPNHHVMPFQNVIATVFSHRFFNKRTNLERTLEVPYPRNNKHGRKIGTILEKNSQKLRSIQMWKIK